MNRRIIPVLVLSIFVGAALVVQFQTGGAQKLYTSRKAVEDYKTMIASEEKAIEEVRAHIEYSKELLEEYRADKYDPETTIVIDNTEAEAEKYQMLAGAVAVKGPGVIITIDDGKRDLYGGEDINNLLVHDLDILMIINELKDCGAEAISVNGQRIVDSTAINCAGWTIRINGRTYARPFTIEAIGDGKKMVSNLLSAHGYGTSLRDWGVIFNIELADEIVIDKYTLERDFFYADPVEEEMVKE